jgi:hypothetical protein
MHADKMTYRQPEHRDTVLSMFTSVASGYIYPDIRQTEQSAILIWPKSKRPSVVSRDGEILFAQRFL